MELSPDERSVDSVPVSLSGNCVLVTLVDRAKVILENALRHSNADLVTVLKRMPPVQAGPNARVTSFQNLVQLALCLRIVKPQTVIAWHPKALGGFGNGRADYDEAP